MEQQIFSDFVQSLTVELRNVVCSVTNTLREKSIQPLVRKEDGGYRTWLENVGRYFRVVPVAK